MSYHNLNSQDVDFLRANCSVFFEDYPTTVFFKSYANNKDYLNKVIIEANKDLILLIEQKNDLEQKRREEIIYLNYLINNY